MSRHYEISEWEWKSLTVDGIYVEVNVHYVGWASDGDAFGYGCEPPDGESHIEEIEVELAYEEETGLAVEITEELIEKIRAKLS